MAKKNILTFLILFSVSNLCLAECDKVGSTDVLDATVQENPFNSSEGRTDNCQETADMLFKIADKLHREMKSGRRKPYYSSEISDNSSTNSNEYIDTIKTQKKNFINKENIGKIMLMQIPGVSANFANIIMTEHPTMIDLICALQEDPNCLDYMTYKTSTGKVRKISKTCIENIKNFLMQYS